MISVAIVDDQELVRTGLRLIVDAEEDMQVVAEAADGAEAVRAADLRQPDVVLMDIRMPGVDGLAATREIVAAGKQPRVIILTTFDADEHVYEALRAGASGFMVKDMPSGEIVSGIRAVARGDALLAPSVTRRLIGVFAAEAGPVDDPDIDQLTERELEVLRLVARGLSNAEIAGVLKISEKTVKTHVGSMLRTLGLRDRVQAVVLAYEVGLARPARR